MCKLCVHGIFLHRNITNSIDNSVFATSPLDQVPQCSFAIAVSNSSRTNQGRPTPNHNTFLPPIAGETSETIVCASTTNHHLTRLSKEFQPHEQKETDKRKKTFNITLMLHLHPTTHRLNHNSPKHKECLDVTHFVCHVTIEYMIISQSPCDHFKEANQERTLDNAGEHGLFQFLTNKSNP